MRLLLIGCLVLILCAGCSHTVKLSPRGSSDEFRSINSVTEDQISRVEWRGDSASSVRNLHVSPKLLIWQDPQSNAKMEMPFSMANTIRVRHAGLGAWEGLEIGAAVGILALATAVYAVSDETNQNRGTRIAVMGLGTLLTAPFLGMAYGSHTGSHIKIHLQP